MSVLTDVLHFRGERVTLYATFKLEDAIPESTGVSVIQPTVTIQYANAANQIVTLVNKGAMSPISDERFFYNWIVPNNAPLTSYTVLYQGIIEGTIASRTEELIVGNPSVTHMSPRKLRYGPSSILQRARDFTVRPHPALPRGTFQ